MKKLNMFISVSTSKVGSQTDDEIEVEYPENATEEELAEIMRSEAVEWVWNNIELTHHVAVK